jgi:hypothetical protein
MPSLGAGTLLSVYVSGITATAQENPSSDDLPISIRRLSRRLHEPESPVESLAGIVSTVKKSTETVQNKQGKRLDR